MTKLIISLLLLGLPAVALAGDIIYLDEALKNQTSNHPVTILDGRVNESGYTCDPDAGDVQNPGSWSDRIIEFKKARLQEKLSGPGSNHKCCRRPLPE